MNVIASQSTSKKIHLSSKKLKKTYVQLTGALEMKKTSKPLTQHGLC